MILSLRHATFRRSPSVADIRKNHLLHRIQTSSWDSLILEKPDFTDTTNINTEPINQNQSVSVETKPQNKTEIYSDVYHKNMVHITDEFKFETVLDEVKSITSFRNCEEVVTAQWISKYFLSGIQFCLSQSHKIEKHFI